MTGIFEVPLTFVNDGSRKCPEDSKSLRPLRGVESNLSDQHECESSPSRKGVMIDTLSCEAANTNQKSKSAC